MSYNCNLRDEKFASVAMLEAEKSNMKHHKHGCIATIGSKIIARGFNSYRCYSNDEFLNDEFVNNTYSCSCHAEIHVIHQLAKILQKKNLQIASSNRNKRKNFYDKISLYVVRRDKHGINFKHSAPCNHCTNIMKTLNIKYIIYSNISGTLTKCRVKDYNTSHISQGNRFLNRIMANNSRNNKKKRR